MNAELTRHALFRERFGGTPTSLVFPRNQVAFLAMYHAQGISAWRDNESPWYYQLARHTNHPVVRGLRMMDALTPWRARGGSFYGGRTPSTLFVRVYLPESLWKLHLARIVSEARRIKQGSVLHVWLTRTISVPTCHAASGVLSGCSMSSADTHHMAPSVCPCVILCRSSLWVIWVEFS
jgi:hypothetical protein